MNGFRRDGRGGLPTMSEVNVTSLVDVAFTLLVIFIITAPILQGGVEVQLPRADSAPITQAEAVVVTIQSDGSIHLGEIPVAGLAELEALYPRYVADKGARAAYIRGDTDVDYGSVLRVLGALKRLDVVEVSLVSDPRVE